MQNTQAQVSARQNTEAVLAGELVSDSGLPAYLIRRIVGGNRTHDDNIRGLHDSVLKEHNTDSSLKEMTLRDLSKISPNALLTERHVGVKALAYIGLAFLRSGTMTMVEVRNWFDRDDGLPSQTKLQAQNERQQAKELVERCLDNNTLDLTALRAPKQL